MVYRRLVSLFATTGILLNALTFSSFATVGNISAINAYNAAVDSYNLLQEAKKQCSAIYLKASFTRRILSAATTARICNYSDANLNEAWRELQKVEPLLQSYDNSTLMKTRDLANAIKTYFENLTYSIDNISVLGDELLVISEEISRIDQYSEKINGFQKRVDITLESLPSRLATEIQSSESFKNYYQLVSTLDKSLSELENFILSISKTSTPDLYVFNKLITQVNKVTSSIPTAEKFNLSIIQMLNSFPKEYCSKGQVTKKLLKSRCPTGYKRSAISVPSQTSIPDSVVSQLAPIVGLKFTRYDFVKPSFNRDVIKRLMVFETKDDFTVAFTPVISPENYGVKTQFEIGIIVGDPWKKSGNGRSVNTEVWDPYIRIFKTISSTQSVISSTFAFAEVETWASREDVSLDRQFFGVVVRTQRGSTFSSWSSEVVSERSIGCITRYSAILPSLTCNKS